MQLRQDRISAMLDGSKKWAYWIVGILLVGGISYMLFQANKQITSVLVFLAGLLALYFYYIKWFVVGTEIWPPFSSVCPDFMTLTDSTATTITCEDLTGVTGTSGKLTFSTKPEDVNTNCSTAASSGLTWLSLCGR